MFPILSTIPGIHATIVGVLAAFFSAFLIFAYQKVTEAQKKLEKALKVAESVSTPNSFVMNGHSSLIDQNGDLDWDGECKNLIHNAKSVFFHLDTVKYGINLEPFHRGIDPQEIIKIVDELTPFFYLFFTYYPMNGKSMVTTPQSALKEHDNKVFDYNRYLEIQRRLAFLTWVWQTSQESLIQLFNVYDQIQEKKLKEEKNIEITRVLADLEKNLGTNQGHEIRARVISQVENSFNSRIEQKQLPFLIEFFQRVQTYQTQVIPILDETIIEFESYNNELKVKKTTKNVLKITIYIMSVGIVFPLVLLEVLSKLENAHNYFIVSYIEYFILLASFLPYFLICIYFFKKIENTIFK
ncbi:MULTISPECIES: hypothetical protein [Acinetobacter]|jgi:hypothetical protein|nr:MULTISPECIES: hypothetical protein [Acinetobacter]KQF18834.1 hypothetical protein APC05_17470 [Acinetobacter pittii]KQG01453.1 hypothetical protein APC29_16840 [Acinetobacter pittii]KRJ20997.1 hypothetical protein APC78_14030 [Acinetobacter pittii]MBM0877419.1 hypothetical protein [Acinetobacter pittii]MCK0871130.1 hypothetical protein [Acinetobacter pittii]